QKKVYAGVEFRRAFAAELERRPVFHDIWERTQVKEVTNPALKSTEWQRVAEIARDRGVAPLDAFFDLALEDELALDYMLPLLDINEERVAKKFSDPRTLIGISDGGAHVDMLCNAGYPTYLLGTFVREKQVLSLEHAVQRITCAPENSQRDRLLQKLLACFDRLRTNGKSSTSSTSDPFALSLSKGERGVFSSLLIP